MKFIWEWNGTNFTLSWLIQIKICQMNKHNNKSYQTP